MNYILYHKNIPVLGIEMNEYDEFVKTNEIINEKHLPLGIKTENKSKSINQNFKAWWQSRGIPASRQNLRQALESLGGITTSTMLCKCYGSSLSDHYWIKPENSGLTWESVNFFTNNFTDDVGKALFGSLNVQDRSKISLRSPDGSLDGWLKKRWFIDNGQRYLLKSGTGLSSPEVFNENLASKICEKLGINHVEYKIVQLKSGRFYSVCPDFIGIDTEFVPAWCIRDTFDKENKNDSPYNHLISCCKQLDMPDSATIEASLCNMTVLDYIIANTDRHYSNFGFIRNPDTLEWRGLAPIFDSGTAMYLDASTASLKKGDYENSYRIPSIAFASNHHEQLKRLPIEKHCKNMDFSKLGGIDTYYKTILSMNEEFSSERKDILSSLLNKRIQEVEKRATQDA